LPFRIHKIPVKIYPRLAIQPKGAHFVLDWLVTTTPMLNWFELLGLILGVIGIIGLPVLTYVRHLYDQHHIISEARSDLVKILEAIPEARCWWRGSETRVHCSTSFAKLLGLNLAHPIEVVDVTNQFDTQSAFILDQAIQHASQIGESFSHKLTLLDQKTLVQVEGMRLVQPQHTVIVLSVIDITDKAFETKRLAEEVKSLRAEHEMLQAMIDSVPVALWYRNADNQVVFCNQSYAGAVESTPALVAQEHKELIEKSRSTSPHHLAVKVRQTGQSQSQRGHIVIDGFRRLLEMTEMAHEGGATVGYAIDLTDSEEMASDLSKHILAHQEVLHQLSTPIAVFGADTRLEFFNNAYTKLFGYEEAWLHTKPTFGDVLQDMRERRKLPEYPDFQAFKRSRLQLFKTLLQPIQELIHQPDDQILRLLIAPHPLGGLLFMYDDVTDKLALERRYNTLIAVQKETLDHLYEGIVVLGSDSRLRLSNPAAARIWQVDMADITPGRHATEILALIRPAFSADEEWNNFQARLLTIISQRVPKTGRFSRADMTMIQYAYVPLPDGSHLLSFIDVSDRWRFEQALQERNQALEQADRIKSDFLSHVSYELRAPLNTVIGFAEILTNQYFGNLNERQVDYCRGIVDSAQRLLALINDILDLASIEAGQMTLAQQPVHLDSFLASVVGLVYNRSHDQGLEISHENKTTIETFVADERRLKQAVFNLLNNAIKYTPSGGRIDLKAFTAEKDDGHELCLSVHDTGVGISDDDRARIFKLFERGPNYSKSKHVGAGLGLSLVKSLIELHGGSINIDSTQGKGTTITCTVPLVEG
jgi:signal transduction histidine kinase